MKKGLLITFYFPPLNSVASHRLYSFAKYLNNDEFKLDVLCPQWSDDLHYDLHNINILHLPSQAFDLNYGYKKPKGISRVKEFILNRIFRYNYFVSSRKHKFYHDAVKMLENMNPGEYDFFITSYGPLDSLHIGNYLKNKYPGKKWIIDYRDLYSEMEYYDFGIFRNIFRKKEKSISKVADGFVTVSQTLKSIQEKLLGIKGEVVYNGFEPYTPVKNESFEKRINEFSRPVLSYTGSLYNGERDVLPFLKYFVSNELFRKFDLVFALINDPDELYLKKCMKDCNFYNIHIFKNLSYDETVTLQNNSSALLLFSGFGGRGNGYLTGKIFEYIGTGKPIIYSGTTEPGYELYDLIRDYRIGESFERFNYSLLKQFPEYNAAFFSRQNQAKILETFIKKLIG